MVAGAYLRAGLNLLNSLLIELSSIGIPILDVEGVFNTGSLALGKAAAMDITNPVEMGLNLGERRRCLQSDNIFAGDDLV